jgi:hypothetical protein
MGVVWPCNGADVELDLTFELEAADDSRDMVERVWTRAEGF